MYYKFIESFFSNIHLIFFIRPEEKIIETSRRRPESSPK